LEKTGKTTAAFMVEPIQVREGEREGGREEEK